MMQFASRKKYVPLPSPYHLTNYCEPVEPTLMQQSAKFDEARRQREEEISENDSLMQTAAVEADK